MQPVGALSDLPALISIRSNEHKKQRKYPANQITVPDLQGIWPEHWAGRRTNYGGPGGWTQHGVSVLQKRNTIHYLR